ncbi:uncharacterized protein [Henckelia pumila]|uniref:uncharacterized protein n=1 Tax=Henckelia pumila TaxID=405737 RepID=UPI003C6E64D6
MKREGRQHGMVRAYEMLSLPSNPRPRRKMVNEFSSPPTAGLFTRVPTKPTNHSKYTGKCGRPRCRGCHSHPVCKSMEKVKGAHKIRSTGAQGLKFYGFSASGALNYLDRMDYDHYDDDDDDDDDEDVDVRDLSFVLEIHEDVADVDVLHEEALCDSPLVDLEIHEDVCVDDDNDDGMGFCEVGLVWEQVDGDESWCFIDEI